MKTFTLTFHDERDFCNTVSPIVGAVYVVGVDAAKAINTWSGKQYRSFGRVTAEINEVEAKEKE